MANSGYTRATQGQTAASFDALKKPESNASYANSRVAKASDPQEGAIHNMIMDTDKDGVVTAAERSAHAADVTAHRDIIDRDGDGKVTFQEELRYALDNQQVTRSEINGFLETDTDKDGVLSDAEKLAFKRNQMALGSYTRAK